MGVCRHRDSYRLHVQDIAEDGISHASRRLTMGRQLPVNHCRHQVPPHLNTHYKLPTTTTHTTYTYMLLPYNEPS
jgi:hypothetical protein